MANESPMSPSPVGPYAAPFAIPPMNLDQGMVNCVQLSVSAWSLAVGSTQVVAVPMQLAAPPSVVRVVAAVLRTTLKHEPPPASAEQVPIGVCPRAQNEMPLYDDAFRQDIQKPRPAP